MIDEGVLGDAHLTKPDGRVRGATGPGVKWLGRVKRTTAVGAMGLVAACQTLPPPPAMTEAGLVHGVPGSAKVQTIEIVAIPRTARCRVTSKGNVIDEFTGRRVIGVSLNTMQLAVDCTAPGFLPGRRAVIAEKTQESAGTGAVAIMLIFGGIGAAVGTAVRMRREKTLWWYPPIAHVVLEPVSAGAANAASGKMAKARSATANTSKRVVSSNGGAAGVSGVAVKPRHQVTARWDAFIASQTKICSSGQPYYRYCVLKDFKHFRALDVAAVPPEGKDRVRDTAAIKALFDGRVIKNGDHSGLRGTPGSITFDTDGSLRGSTQNTSIRDSGDSYAASTDRGTWKVEGGQMCVKWSSWDEGVTHCYYVSKTETTVGLHGASGRLAGTISLE